MDRKLTTIERAFLTRRLEQNSQRIKRLESILKGIPIATARFANATIVDAKIASLSADKILSGNISIGTEIIVNDGTNDRILLTYNEIRISKPGVDVMQTITETNKKDFIVISSVDAHKIVHCGYVTSGSYTHGLGRVPFYLVFEVDSTSSPTYFRANTESRASSTTISNIPNPSYIIVFNEGGNP